MSDLQGSIEYVEKYDLYLDGEVLVKNIPAFLKRVNKVPYYWSKIRTIRYNKWLIIYFYVFLIGKKHRLPGVELNSNVLRYKGVFKYNHLHLKNSFLNDSFFNF